jgi:hypothetical protein
MRRDCADHDNPLLRLVEDGIEQRNFKLQSRSEQITGSRQRLLPSPFFLVAI